MALSKVDIVLSTLEGLTLCNPRTLMENEAFMKKLNGIINDKTTFEVVDELMVFIEKEELI